MGVYIKGIEMPTSCDKCRIMVFEDTNCEPELYCGCPIVFKAHPQGVDHRPDYCPLVPVPPHGRLIDADALRCLYDPHDYGLDGEQADEYDRYHVSLPVIRQNIDDMPTIIPAEEENK